MLDNISIISKMLKKINRGRIFGFTYQKLFFVPVFKLAQKINGFLRLKIFIFTSVMAALSSLDFS